MKVAGLGLVMMLALPGVGAAQARGPGRAGAESTTESMPSELSSKKIQRFDPIRVILDHRKDLKIDDKQRGELDQLESQVQWNLRRLTARIDTAQKRARPDGGVANDARDLSRSRGGGGRRGADAGGAVIDQANESMESRRERLLKSRKTIFDAIDELQIEFDSTGARAVRGLSEAQRTAAADVLTKHRAELSKLLKDAGFSPKS